MEQALSFEQGPIRPPSEAGSLLIRATRNCPWNKCLFCNTYKGKPFSRRSLEEIKGDVDAARAVADRISDISWQLGDGGALSHRVFSHILRDPSLPDSFHSVAHWLASGGRTVFLQDANSLMLSTDTLVALLDHIRERFPQVERVTSYARAGTLKGKTVEQFVRLKKAGLSRLHVGMESGSDRVLKLIQKGSTAQQLIEGGRRVVEAGISLCLYIMPGIGGTELSQDHVAGTANVINAINPGFMRFRSLYIRRGSPLEKMADEGTFLPPNEDGMVMEIKGIIERLDGITTTIVSDHILNLLEDVEGKLPEDKQRMLDIIDGYLSMPDEERVLFQLARRGGAVRGLVDFRDAGLRRRLLEAKKEIEAEVPGGVPEYIQAMKRRFV